MHRACSILICAVLLPVWAAAQQTPTVEEIVQRMCQARELNQARVRAYTVTRDYKLYHEGPVAKAEVQAQISFLPPNKKEFRISHARGGGYGEKVIRKVLEGETRANKDDSGVEITPRNYDFKLLRTEPGAYVLQLIPKRDEKNLVEGHAWVDANSYLIRRIEGRLAKSPSFWVKKVKVVLTYGDVEGMWLQTSTHATADVRFKGEYQMVGRDVAYQTSATVAQSRPARSRAQRSTVSVPAVSLGSALVP